MKPIKPALLASAALISLLSLFPAASHAADAARVAGNLKVDGLHFSGDPNNTLITKPSDLAFPWTILDQNIYYLTGNVGIGWMQPDSALTVKSADSSPVRIGTTGCGANFAGIGLFGLMSGCGNYSIMGENSATQNLLINRPAGGDIDFRMSNGNQMVLDHFGGLHLDANDANDGVFNHTSTTGAGLAFGAGSGEGIASKRTAGGNRWGLDFYTSGTPRLSITYGGNVGIGTGTTLPGSKLTVAGPIETTSGGVKFPDGTVQTTALATSGSGDVTIAPPGVLKFGNATRQMLSLWDGSYGIGIQNYTLYQRSGGGFAWFNNGVHSDTTLDPGAGGTNLMWLDSGGSLFTKGSVTVDATDANVAKGGLPPRLIFGGNGSGEAIASQRGITGSNRFGLDFYTGSTPRLSISHAGTVAVRNNAGASTISMDGQTGNIAANNLPGVQFDVPADPFNGGVLFSIMSGQTATVKTITIAVPADGYLVLTGSVYGNTIPGSSQIPLTTASLQLFDETANTTFASAFFFTNAMATHTIQGVLSVTAGSRILSLKLQTGSFDPGDMTRYYSNTGSLIAMYFPVRY